MKNHLIYAIGDVHGCLKSLDALWLKIEDHMNSNPAEKRTVVFLGDYVDRGPDSAGVIHRLLEMKALLPENGIRIVTLKGNHEDMMISALEHPLSSDSNLWVYNGGIQTMASYEGEVPEEHTSFLKSLRIWEKIGRFVFVHAGIEPFCEMEDQSDRIMIWGRDYVEYNGPFDDEEKMFVVHGHTPGENYVQLAHQLNLDSACVFGSNYHLTCAVIDPDNEENDFEFLQVKNADRD